MSADFSHSRRVLIHLRNISDKDSYIAQTCFRQNNLFDMVHRVNITPNGYIVKWWAEMTKASRIYLFKDVSYRTRG